MASSVLPQVFLVFGDVDMISLKNYIECLAEWRTVDPTPHGCIMAMMDLFEQNEEWLLFYAKIVKC